jgi:hypothetical protein
MSTNFRYSSTYAEMIDRSVCGHYPPDKISLQSGDFKAANQSLLLWVNLKL